MKTIDLESYMGSLTSLYAFYRYSETVFSNHQLRSQIAEQEFTKLFAVAAEFLKDDVKPEEAKPHFRQEIHDQVVANIEGGLSVLRQQMLETSHSIFEKYLCHVLRVYLHTFPEILMDIDKHVSFRTVCELKDDNSVFDHIVEKEVEHFSRRSMQEKKDYVAKRLKHTRQDETWLYDGEELWKDIERKRQAIVHHEETVDISNDYLLRAMNGFQSMIMGIGIFAQVDQGVPIAWKDMATYVKSKPYPTLKGSDPTRV